MSARRQNPRTFWAILAVLQRRSLSGCRAICPELVLQYIPFEDFSKLIPYMHIREVDPKEVLHQAGEPIRFIYFPITALKFRPVTWGIP
ncbi:MAG: hypothetical protein LV473_18500 [Nitrospira sp.]|nr:hypothetical protein [Nitrospira sp.]